VKEDLDFSFFVSVALIKLRQHRAFPQFIAFALESPQVLKQVQRLGEGAGLKHMVLKSIRALEVPLPPLETQQQVAEELNAAFLEAQSLREQLAQKLAAVEKLPATLLRAGFNGSI
jgi:type I restriction enzyme S subunit